MASFQHFRMKAIAVSRGGDRGRATVLCTANTRDFPAAGVAALGLEVMTPDALLSALVTEFPSQMLTVHATSVERLRGATDESTIAALQRAGAPTAAALVAGLLHNHW